MKNIYYYIIVAMLLLPAVAHAQKKHANTFYVGYDNVKLANLKDKTEDRTDLPFHGFTVGWRYEIKPRVDIDLYVDAGLEFGWNYCRADYGDYYTDYISDIGINTEIEQDLWTLRDYIENHVLHENWGGVKLPLDIAYEFKVKNTKLAFRPFIGLHVGYIFSAKRRDEFDEKLDYVEYNVGQEPKETVTEWEHEDISQSIMSGSTEDYNSRAFKHLYAGWQIGLNVIYDHYSIGFTFENEMMHMNSYYKSRTLTVKLGYTL